MAKCPMCGTEFTKARVYCSMRCSTAVGRPTLCDTAKVLEDVARGMSFQEVAGLHNIDRKAVRELVQILAGFTLPHGGNPAKKRAMEKWAPRLRQLAREWRRTIGTPEATIITRADKEKV